MIKEPKAEDFEGLVSDCTIITGGHYMLTASGALLNDGTIESFRLAVNLYAKTKPTNVHVGLGILVNNMGSTCSATACSPVAHFDTENFSLPSQYTEILQSANVNPEELQVVFEKFCRNRGKKLLDKLVRDEVPELVYRDGGYSYLSSSDDDEIVLSRRSIYDRRGTPACPLIMCAYYIGYKRMGFDRSVNFYYVGDDNYENISNHFVIEKGRYLASIIYGNIDVKNVYRFPDGVLTNVQ